MNTPNPLDSIFNELSKILDFIEKNKIDPKGEPISSDILDRLKLLRTRIDLMTSVTQKTLKDAGINQVDINKSLSDSQNLTPAVRRLLQKAARLKQQAEVQQRKIQKQVRIAKALEKQYGKSLDQTEMAKKRKKKFKAIGGSNWLPL